MPKIISVKFLVWLYTHQKHQQVESYRYNHFSQIRQTSLTKMVPTIDKTMNIMTLKDTIGKIPLCSRRWSQQSIKKWRLWLQKGTIFEIKIN